MPFLTTRFQLLDPSNTPIPDVEVRVVFGCEPGWHSAGAGRQFVTDAEGRAEFTTEITLDRRLRKVPTNFWSSLVSLPQWTDHLTVATELEYMTFPWLYVAEINRFSGGDPVMVDGIAVYTRDAAGNFTIPARQVDGGWQMAELGGMRLTSPGHEIADFALQPDDDDPAGERWTLRLAYRRWPAPEIR